MVLPPHTITKADIEMLISNAIGESRHVEYKATLPDLGNRAEKIEFLADVAAFANASGGDLIYGVAATEGVATEAFGVEAPSVDKLVLRLDQVIRTGIDPRVRVRIEPVDGFVRGPVVVIRIARSWNAPHMIATLRSPFYTRSNAGKHPMDATEIRAAFTLAGSLSERVREFRLGRLARIVADETPGPLERGPRLVLHIVPVQAFTQGLNLDPTLLYEASLAPIGTAGWSGRYNLDGVVTYTGEEDMSEPARAYTQLFRSGAVEAVCAFRRRADDVDVISSQKYESDVVSAVGQYLSALRGLEVQTPHTVSMALLSVRGARFTVSPRLVWEQPLPIRQDELLLPDVLLEDYDADIPRALKPIFDAVWNAAGFAGSHNYNESGEWVGQR